MNDENTHTEIHIMITPEELATLRKALCIALGWGRPEDLIHPWDDQDSEISETLLNAALL